jgi:division protein CdvB (Snf7/Vps24/ESCRT-III family)
MNWVKYNHDRLKDLEQQYLKDHKRGLLTNSQLLNMIHRLDRISARLGANDK